MDQGFEERFQDALSTLIGSRMIEADDVRATALNTLTDLILETARRGDRHVPAHFGELMGALLPRVSPQIRATISRRLAPCDLVSPEIARHIIAESAEIAAPMLRHSPVLTASDLYAVAVGDCEEKARAVAARTDLTADMVSALIDRQDPAIATSLVLAETAVVDGSTAERIAAIPNLPRAAARRLIETADLSDDALARLFWLVDEDARRTILERIADRRGGDKVNEPAPPQNSGVELGDTLFALAAVGERAEIAHRLASTLSLPRALSARIVGDLHGEPLAVATRAAGIPADQATGIILLTVTEAGSSYDVLRTLAGLAERLTPTIARHVVGLWNSAPASRSAARHEPSVARPSARAPRSAAGAPRRLEDVVADLSRRTGS
ncbi:DUF2336 domain-containing protein [Microbaculum marinisediminis]|uniref:DUF2336 domain-containing protein n=1 Tax=Microbaculum marinisediminis TaxID=2931392 RepID=A0AAW5QT10_9HYPH|nr:DUF2336 domain-containing protein [Microbaculum sp. A6E488]MCT8971241.1 DUF2336 domain-containing protein [Microbaculum sp. A6E488]